MKKEKEVFAPPLIADLPNAWDEAHESFEVLERCVYESKKMGASRETDEMMVCDCVYDKREFWVGWWECWIDEEASGWMARLMSWGSSRRKRVMGCQTFG